MFTCISLSFSVIKICIFIIKSDIKIVPTTEDKITIVLPNVVIGYISP